MRRTKIWLTVIVTILVAIVILQNTETVQTDLLFVKVSLPRALLLLVAILVGFVIGLVMGGRIRKAEDAAKKATQAPETEGDPGTLWKS